MSEYKDIQRALRRARIMCEELEYHGERQSGGAPAPRGREFDERYAALEAVETMLKSLHGALATANALMQNRFLREARIGALRKPH